MDFAQLDHSADLHIYRSSRLKIRRSLSCKVSATSTFSSCLSHGSCTQMKAPPPSKAVFQPLIIHAVDPKIVNVEPVEFMQLVQMLTGSPSTLRLVRTCIRRSKAMIKELSSQNQEVQQQSTDSPQDSNHDELQMRTISADSFANDQFPSPSFRNPVLINVISDNSPCLVQGVVSPFSPACNDAGNSTASDSLGSPLSYGGTNQQNIKRNHPALSSSSDSASSSTYRGLSTPCSPISSFSATSSSEAQNMVSTEIGDAYWGAFFPQQNSTTSGDGGIDFFHYPVDSYYGGFEALDCLTTSLGVFPAVS